jgi:hypothetical protein
MRMFCSCCRDSQHCRYDLTLQDAAALPFVHQLAVLLQCSPAKVLQVSGRQRVRNTHANPWVCT